MKNKKLLAFIVGLLCLVILVSVSVGSCAKNEEDDPKSDHAQSEEQKNQTPSVETENKIPEPDDKEEPEQPDPAPSVDEEPSVEPEQKEPEQKEPEQKEPEQSEPKPAEKPEQKEEPVQYEDPADVISELDYSTKEGIEAILNNPYMIFVNRDHRVNSDYAPSNLVSFRGGYKLNSTCSAALNKLVKAGENAGYSYTLYSGYRTYSSQHNKYYNKIEYWKNQGYSEAKAIELTDQYYAPPGASEHHTGLAADVCIPSIVNKYACLHENYDQTEEFRWFSANAHKYGFILRYPKGGESITGYNYEPWHYRFVGVAIATDIYNRGITMEEYVAELESKLKSFE